MVKVFQSLPSFSHNGSFEGWIRRIVVNTAIDSNRKKMKLMEVEDEFARDNTDETELDPEEFESGIKMNDLLEMVQSLSPMYRTVFNLYVFENLSHQDIAEQLNISVGTSKSNLAKARMNLKKSIQSRMEVYNGK